MKRVRRRAPPLILAFVFVAVRFAWLLCCRFFSAFPSPFLGNAKRVRTMIGASEDDFKLLIVKRFVIVFEDGITVIRHWRVHNIIQKDRFKETIYVDERARLGFDKNKAYTEAAYQGTRRCRLLILRTFAFLPLFGPSVRTVSRCYLRAAYRKSAAAKARLRKAV